MPRGADPTSVIAFAVPPQVMPEGAALGPFGTATNRHD
jgi:hypothetical protein